MNGFRNWLQRVGMNFSNGLRRFMAGRHGSDKLNLTILTVGLVICLVGVLIPVAWVRMVCSLVSDALMIWALFRMLSRNIYKRYEENRRYLMLLDQIRDRDHKYFSCPKCHQPVRVPRGKGKISITCPRCKEKFVRKT